MVAKRKHGLSKKLRLAFLPLLANRSVNTESIRSVANSVGQGVSSLSTSQIRLDLEKGEKILFDDDVAREINLPLQDGSHFTWPIASPQGLLRKYSAASPALRRMLSKSPNTADRPWGLVHYHDEVSPGDILRPILSRQHTVFRFTFKEFGKTMLSNTRLWFTYAVLRTTVSKRVVGGLSRCFKELMRVFFKTHENFHEVGVAIDTDAGKTLFFAVNRNVVADEKALKMTFSFKGASGSKPCGACANVFMKGFSKNKKTKKRSSRRRAPAQSTSRASIGRASCRTQTKRFGNTTTCWTRLKIRCRRPSSRKWKLPWGPSTTQKAWLLIRTCVRCSAPWTC